ncbi:MAG: PepSY-associated TM helix domain-containing protein, partial [Bacteroidota bacterium]
MKETFRLSMLWLHTWAGVVIGSLLFIIFWMGTLSVFNYDIDRWMMPDTRIDPPEAFSYDAFAEEVGAFLPEGIQEWGLITPRDRIPMAYLYHRDSTGVFGESVTLDLARMEPIPDQGTLAGTGFIFPFHYSLHLSWKGIGYWIVGAAAMAMMLLLITGVIVHIRIFKDFFTLRPKKKLPRSTLDLHNLSGVLALPFHFMIALSGVIIFMNIYFPQAAELAYAEEEVPRTAFFNEAYDFYTRPATGEPLAESFSIDAMVATAAAAWDGIPPYYVRVIHPGDA